MSEEAVERQSSAASTLPRVRRNLSNARSMLYIGLPVGIGLTVHLLGRLAYRRGWVELYTSDAWTLFGIMVLLLSVAVAINRVYRMSLITYASLAASGFIIAGQAINLASRHPAWGLQGTETAAYSTLTLLKESSFVAGIVLLFSVFLMSLLEANRARVFLAAAYADIEQKVNERTASLLEANERLGREIQVRREAEDAFRLSEEKFRALVENSADLILRLDTDLRILYVNPTALAATGRQGDDLNGRPVAVLLGPSRGAEAWHRAARQVIDSGRPGRAATSVADNGRFQLLDWSIAPETDAAGCVSSLLVVARDVTELWRKEEERRTLEEQLLQSQKLESIGRLAGGVAHDFNNLLQVISGYVEIMTGEIEPEHRARARLRQVERATRRAAGLVRQLLAFGRRGTMRCECVDLGRLVLDMVKMLQRVLGEQHEISIESPPELPPIYADPGHVEQVLMNLCLNARDAMPGGGTIRIGARAVRISEEVADAHPGSRAGNYVETLVSDSGGGMTPELLSHIFEPFFTTKETGKGTGLGLSVVYGIVQQHGGFLDVESRPGEGSTFSVFLPTAPEAAMKSAAEDMNPPPPDGNGETILLAEDDELVRGWAASILENAGYRVVTAADGLEAVKIIEQRHTGIDLFVLDVIMPRLTGKDVRKALIARRPDAKVLFVTGHSFDLLAEFNLPDQKYDLLYKPFTANSLLARVHSMLDGENPA